MEPEVKNNTAAPETETDAELEASNPPVMRKVGVPRFFEILGRDLWPIYKASFLCLIGFAPGFAALVAGAMLQSLPLCLVGGLVGGLVAAPFFCGLCDTILRALRDEPGYWWHTYRRAWKQNWRESLIPGALFGFWAGLWCWLLATLPGMDGVPTPVWLCLIVGVFFAIGFFSYVFAQIALVALPLKKMLKNAGYFFIGFLPRTLAATLVQGLYWGALLLYMPYTLPLTLVTGFWLPTIIALQILYPALDKVFHLESTINQRRDAEIESSLAAQAPKFDTK